jgi:polyhydroxybutyrate depolymerase
MNTYKARLRLTLGPALALALLALCGAVRAESIVADGVTRTFTAVVAANRPAPLVIVLHGNTQTSADMISRTSWPALARREQFSAVFPDGLNRAWADLRPNDRRGGRVPPEGTDDVAFIARLIEKYVADGVADRSRIYVTGLSNGGAMTMTLICKRADLFAATASVIINLTDESAQACHPSRAVPMLMMNGTADPLVPYEGGRGTSRFAIDGFWSTEETLLFWRRSNGCEADDASSVELQHRDTADQSTVTLVNSRCPRGQDVVLYRINGGGHRMPSSSSDTRFVRLVNFHVRPAEPRHRRRGSDLGFLQTLSVMGGNCAMAARRAIA